MMWYEVFGWLATTMGILMYFPQMVKTVRTKDVSQLSKFTFASVAFGSALWTISTIAIANKAYPGWAANFVITLMMFPIMRYIYKTKTFIGFSAILAGILSTSIVIWILNLQMTEWVQYVIVIVASCCTGLPFFPQLFKVIKSKNTSSLSWISSTLVIMCGVLWTIFWSGKIADQWQEPGLGIVIISLISSIPLFLVQIPLLWMCIHHKIKTRAN